MADAIIRLDRSKTFSECRGERTPDDPHYHVHFWQGQRVGKDMVLLPFNAEGELVPDDGRTEPYQGMADGKPVIHHPLYTKAMRDMVERKKKRQIATSPVVGTASDVVEEDAEIEEAEEVNFVSYLRGEAKYEPHLLRAAAKKRFSKNYPKISELVADLVLDEKVVPEDQVCPALARYLPAKAA